MKVLDRHRQGEFNLIGEMKLYHGQYELYFRMLVGQLAALL